MNLNDGTTSYDFTLLPHKMTMIGKDRACAAVETYTSVAFFSWGTSIVGKVIDFTWNAMPGDMWGKLETFYENDAPLTWTPDNTKTYTVEMIALNGSYYIGYVDTDSNALRIDVTMSLLILSMLA